MTSSATSTLRRILEATPSREGEVVPQIFLGSYGDALKVKFGRRPEITRVISFHNTQTTSVPVLGLFDVSSDLSSIQKAISEKRVFEVLDVALLKGENVLVHCSNGQVRSVALVIYYIMKRLRLPFDEAKKLIEKRYPRMQLTSEMVRELRSVDIR